MYSTGLVDPTTKKGKARLWPGYKQIALSPDRGITRYTLAPGATGLGASTPIYLGEANLNGRIDPTTATAVPPGGFQFSRYDLAPDTRTVLKSDFTGSINAMTRSFDPRGTGEAFIAIGTGAGQFWRYDIGPGTFTLERTGSGIEVDSIVQYGDALYYGAGASLWKRTHDGTTLAHTEVKKINGVITVRGGVVWNNRLWFCGVATGGLCQLFVSDGVTVTPALTMPEAFELRAMVVHYGSLYLVGDHSASAAAGSYVGQVWRYSGSSLTKIYEEGTGADAEQHVFWDAASFGKYLAWGKPGVTSTGKAPGVTLYDAEADAIIDGPTIEQDAASGLVAPGSVSVWNNTLVATFHDYRTYTGAIIGPVVAAYVKLGDQVRSTFSGLSGLSFEGQSPTLQRTLLSSRFDGDIPGEKKVWLTGRLRVKLPDANSSVLVYALLDEGTTEQLLATINYDAATPGWRTVTFPMKVGGLYLRSTAIQYKLYLRNTDSGNTNSTANPEVDSVEIDYMPSPKKRRSWRARVSATDGQLRLDGTANPLNNTSLLVDQLETLFFEQEPVLFWDAGTTGGVPGGAGTEVFMTDFLAQPYRVESADTTTAADCSFGLTEIVQS